MADPLSLERVKELLHYDLLTGILTWTQAEDVPVRFRGKTAGCRNGSGYIQIVLNYKIYLAHRLAFFWMIGTRPQKFLDHEDQVKHNNRWNNLREADDTINGHNRKKHVTNSSGVMGVRWEAGKWRARITLSGKLVSLGRFSEWEDAVNARKQAELENGFHSNHGRP